MFKKLLIALPLIFSVPAELPAGEFEAIDLGKPGISQKKEGAKPQAPTATGKADTAECADDPRLETEIVEIMETDDPVIVPPITVTPETFISMEPEVLAKLAGQLVICPKNPLLKSGKPLRKVEVDFPILWEQIQKAVLAGDEGKIKTLLMNFSSKPLPPLDIVNLLNMPPFDKEKSEFLYKAAGMNPEAPFKTSVDFFNLTGGRAVEKALILIDAPSSKPTLFPKDEEPIEISKWKKEHNIDAPVIGLPSVNSSEAASYIINTLHGSGLEVQKYIK